MKVLDISNDYSNRVQDAVKSLNQGNLIIYPTETCYGIAADPTNREAISSLIAYKGDRHRQISIAVSDKSMAKRYVKLNSMADNIYNEFLPGPITVISNSLHKLDERLESVDGTLGVRIPDYNFALDLIEEFGKPITATSANTSGKKEPYSWGDWDKYTVISKKDQVALFLDAGHLKERPTSTVIDTTLNEPEILRQGEIILPASSPSFTSASPKETMRISGHLTSKYLNLLKKYPLIFALQGDLGAGKTQFAKGIASVLKIKSNITSPTYTLMKEYPFSLPKYRGIFYHLDTWRLNDMTELETTLHLSSLLNPGNIICLEWASKAKPYLDRYKENYPILYVDFKELENKNRKITYALSLPEWS